MAISFELNAEPRQDQGKGASRRLRRAGKVPGIIYGARKDAQAVAFDHNELQRSLQHEAVYSHILTIKLGKEQEQAILKDVQRHPSKPVVLHVDLLRVSADEEIRVHVPLHFLNEVSATGVKQQGGVISHHLIDVEVECLPGILPEYIEVDIANLELGQAIHLSELKLPEGVSIVALLHDAEEHDLPVVSIHHPRVAEEEEPAEAEAAATTEVPTVGEEKKEEAGKEEKGKEEAKK